jgi:thioredoxin reductase (NADPH)
MKTFTHHSPVIIIGSGPAGLTAALYAARANLQPVVIRGLAPGGLIATTDTVENYPGFPDAINGFDLADKMEKQAARFGTTFIDGLVESVRFSTGSGLDGIAVPHVVTLDSGTSYTADAVILATGASPRKLHVPGEERLLNRGVSYCAVCDGFFFRDKRIVVVGGGNSAVEEGLFLTRFASEVVVVHRRDALRADPVLQERAFGHPKMRFAWNTVMTEIVGDGRVEAVRLTHLDTGVEETLPTDAVFPYIGHLPNTSLFVGQIDLDRDGYIVTDGRTRTSAPGVFATGDAVDRVYRQAITAAASGAQGAMEATRYLDSVEATAQSQAATLLEVGPALGAW